MQTIDRRRFNTGLFLGSGLGGCAQVPTGAPDLIVTGLRWSEDDGATWHTGPIQAGSNVWFEADVKNQGTGPTPDGVIVGVAFRANGTMVAWSDNYTTALPAGQTISLRANGGPDGDKYWNNVQAGSYTIRAHVDDVNRIPNELDETNNTLDVPMAVGVPTGVQAQQADAFIDSVMVATHFNRSDYQARFATLKQRMLDANIRYFRDSVLCFQSGNVTYVNQLYADGIKGTYTTNLSGDNWPATAYSNIQSRAAGGFAQVAGMLGMNEPAINGRTPAEAWTVQVNLWNTFRINGTAAAKAIPIWPCSPTSPSEADSHEAYGLTQSANGWIDVADGGHTHPYPTGQHPEFGQTPTYPFGSLFYNMSQIGEKVGGVGRPQVATETGYRYPPSTHQNRIPEDVGGIYVPRLYLFYFGWGLPSGAKNARTAIYQLLDDSEHFKLINTDNSTTPAYDGLKNLMNRLADPGAPFTPGFLNYHLSGSLTNVHQLLLQKRDGVFYLVVWLGVSGYNQTTDQRITVNPQSVTLEFDSGQFSVDRNFPNDNTTWTSLGTNLSSANLSVGEKVQILRITPLMAIAANNRNTGLIKN